MSIPTVKIRFSILLSLVLFLVQTVHAGPFKRVDDADLMPDFTLQDHNGDVFTNADLLDKWTLVLVGFTSCPDVCRGLLQRRPHTCGQAQTPHL